MTSHSKLLKISEISDWLGVSRSTIYKWVSEGRFPSPIKFGATDRSRVAARWDESTVEQWIKDRRDESNP